MPEVNAKKLIFCLCTAMVSATAASGSLAEYEALEKSAKAGDYQAQRNVAYWLSGGYSGAPPLNPVLACAWRLVILESGSTSVDSSDVSNKKLYCDRRLDADGVKAAQAQARTLQKSIPKGKRKAPAPQ